MSDELTVTTLTETKSKKEILKILSDQKLVDKLIDQVKIQALSVVPNVSTKAGRDAIGSIALKVSKSRTAITDVADMAVKDLKAQVKEVNDTKKYIESELNTVRAQVLKPRDDWKAEQERKEKERIAKLEDRIANISNLINVLPTNTLSEIGDAIDALEAITISESDFEEYAIKAFETKQNCINTLQDKAQRLAEDARRHEEQEKLRLLELKSAIQEIKALPGELMDKPSSFIHSEIKLLQHRDLSNFAEMECEAKEVITETIKKLERLASLNEPAITDISTDSAPPLSNEALEQKITPVSDPSIGIVLKPIKVFESATQTTPACKAENKMLSTLKADAERARLQAEQAWHAYACECEVGGPEREFAFAVYDRIRTATRIAA